MMNTTSSFRPLALAVVVLAWVTLVLVAISLGSRPAEAQEEGAVVIKEFSCFAFLPPAPYVETTEKTESVITPSGTTQLTCHFQGQPISEKVVAEDFLCNTYLGVTTESFFVYTPSGQGTLTCFINPGG
jgi:hypothetical protein